MGAIRSRGATPRGRYRSDDKTWMFSRAQIWVFGRRGMAFAQGMESTVRADWRHNLLGWASFASVTGSFILPVTMGHAELAPISSIQAANSDPRLIADPQSLQGDEVSYSDTTAEKATVVRSSVEQADAALDPDMECMAKVVMHEAGNQSRAGQLAVAQILINRANSGRFPASICGVANQQGQFFATAAYHPSRSSSQWKSAVDVSREAMAGADDVTHGAYFYHANYVPRSSFFRSRQKVAQLGAHDFYR